MSARSCTGTPQGLTPLNTGTRGDKWGDKCLQHCGATGRLLVAGVRVAVAHRLGYSVHVCAKKGCARLCIVFRCFHLALVVFFPLLFQCETTSGSFVYLESMVHMILPAVSLLRWALAVVFSGLNFTCLVVTCGRMLWLRSVTCRACICAYFFNIWQTLTTVSHLVPASLQHLQPGPTRSNFRHPVALFRSGAHRFVASQFW